MIFSYDIEHAIHFLVHEFAVAKMRIMVFSTYRTIVKKMPLIFCIDINVIDTIENNRNKEQTQKPINFI